MATIIKIGHASISENNTAYGQAGDSTSKEVCIKSDFDITSLSPTVVLRPKTSSLAEASALACEAGCANDKIGYSQSGRNTLYTYASEVGYDLSKVTTLCNTDCSAFMTVCAIAGGANISYGTNAPTTTNMRTRFKQSGNYTVLTDSKHTTMTDYLKRGDILVCEGDHTVMVLENGSGEPDYSGGSTSVTPTRSIRTYSLDTQITNITSSAATIKLNVIEHMNNTEKILTDISKWSYSLSVKDMSSSKETKRTFTGNKVSLDGLTTGNSYLVQVNAIKADGSITFCSAYKVFTTEQKRSAADKSQHVEFGDKISVEPFKPIDKIYIKDKDSYKQAIIYKNT